MTKIFALEFFTIYERPRDYPRHFVVRRWFVRSRDPEAGDCQLADTLEEARSLIPPGLACLGRVENDDPGIVETWL